MNKSPMNIFALMLLAYTLITVGINAIMGSSLDLVLYAVVVSVLMGLAYTSGKYLFKVPGLSWQNTTISACILLLVIDPLTGVTGYAMLALITLMFVLVKKIRYKGMPVVNPIIGGILLASLILLMFGMDTPFFDSWWGTAYLGSWSLLWLAPVALCGVKYFRKYYIALAYFATYALLFAITGKMSPVFLLTTGTLYFAATIMVAEPKTSPALTNEQIVFGILGGVATFLCALWISNLALLWGIAITNLLFVAWKAVKPKLQKSPASPAQSN